MRKFDPHVLKDLYEPGENSHKGENGRLLVIGGSKLFHASIFWSADAASRFVDLVHFTSPANENNELVRYKLKQGFWSGIVVDWSEVEEYIEEDDCVLIGPGMVRSESAGDPTTAKRRTDALRAQDDTLDLESLSSVSSEQLISAGFDDTRTIVNTLLAKYPEKKWVVDGGALQEVEVTLLNQHHIITPHQREFLGLVKRSKDEFLISNIQFLSNFQNSNDQIEKLIEVVLYFSKTFSNVTVLLKGKVDIVCRGDECVVVEGGNAGMTKGGTGDVLAGVVAALYTKNEAFLTAQAGSYLTKLAGDRLFEKVGYWFNAGDLVREVGKSD